MKNIILSVSIGLSILVTGPFVTQTVYAACPGNNAGTAKDQVLNGIGDTGSDCSGSGVTDFISKVVSILSYVVGVAAIIVIILSGLRYITAAGDSAKITSAKNTLIYALIGIAVAALAQFLVNFAFKVSSNASCGSGYHISADGSQCVKN